MTYVQIQPAGLGFFADGQDAGCSNSLAPPAMPATCQRGLRKRSPYTARTSWASSCKQNVGAVLVAARHAGNLPARAPQAEPLHRSHIMGQFLQQNVGAVLVAARHAGDLPARAPQAEPLHRSHIMGQFLQQNVGAVLAPPAVSATCQRGLRKRSPYTARTSWASSCKQNVGAVLVAARHAGNLPSGGASCRLREALRRATPRALLRQAESTP
jgi:hypothetical protein